LILKQFYLPCLAHASYLIADQATGTAAVVDPQRDIDQYLAFASEHALRIGHVFLTHLHADFAAGHLELRDRVGATIYLGAAAEATYPFTPLRDGATVEFGSVRLQALETPGHTPESISIVVYDRSASDTQPHAVLTGDTLFTEKLDLLPRDRPLLIYCAGGYRSSIASSLLQKHGFSSVAEIAGGITAWEAAHLPIQAA
jgi:hydroxyacylglutathione hydrolase